MPGLWKEWKAKNAFHSFHEPLGNLAQPQARFPHSHSAGDEGRGKVENHKTVFHFPTAPIPCPKDQTQNPGRPTSKPTKGDILQQIRLPRMHRKFQAHPALEPNYRFRLIPRWNEFSISGSFLDWKMLRAMRPNVVA